MGWPHCKRLVKIGGKDWKKDWQKIGWFFFTLPTMPEKGKGKAQGGQDTREGGSSHEKRAAKKRKTQMGAQEKNLKWMLTGEFRKGVAFVEDQEKRWTTIFTHPSGGDLLKDKNLRSLTRGFNRMCHVQRLHLPVKQRCLRLQRLVEKGLVHSRLDCRRSMLQHIMCNCGCSCRCDA